MSGKAYIGVSGGVDSMCLLYLLQILVKMGRIKKVTAIFIDHGTRKEIEDEKKMIEKFCKDYDIPLKVFSLSLSLKDSNFEMFAREKRYEIFKGLLQKGDLFYTAHHIDDSFEWSLMQSFKSSDPRKSLGIPVFNRGFARPFLCFTKEQIRVLSKKFRIPYLEDTSNLNEKFERNFIRRNIVPVIRDRYPSYLKNYVQRSLLLASQWKVLRAQNVKLFQKETPFGIIYVDQTFSHSFEGSLQVIYDAIYKLSNAHRGGIRKQAKKMIDMEKKGVKGPLIFSGNVWGMTLPNVLFFTQSQGSKDFSRLDKYWASSIKDLVEKECFSKKNQKEIQRAFSWETALFPFFVIGKGKVPPFALKKHHFLFPETHSVIENLGLWWTYASKLYSMQDAKISSFEFEILEFEGVAE